MPKLPFMRFYPADYLIATRSLTDTEKAIWMDLLCFMWLKPEDRGNLEHHREDLARMVGRDRLTLDITLTSLRNKGICDLKDRENQVVFVECRRMVRDAKSLELNNKRQKRFNAKNNATLTGNKTEDRRQKTEEKDSSSNQRPFDVFWGAYPRKVGKDAAFKVWERKTPPLEAVLKSLAAWRGCGQWTRDDGQFIPHPATWLNAGRWQDDPPVGNGLPAFEREAQQIIQDKINAKR